MHIGQQSVVEMSAYGYILFFLQFTQQLDLHSSELSIAEMVELIPRAPNIKKR